jgi:PAS domain S-box-containing protein
MSRGLSRQSDTTIRGRLVLLTLGLLIPGLLVGAYLLWDSYRNARAAFDRQLLSTSRALSLVVDRELGQAAALNRALSVSVNLQTGNLKGFDDQARRIETSDSTWIVLTDEDGDQLVNTRVPYGTQLAKKDSVAAQIWPEMKQGRTVVSGLYQGALIDRPIITVTTPVEAGGQVRYALHFVMLPSVLNRILAEQELPEGWVGTILDEDQNVVARSAGGEEMIGRKPPPAIATSLSKIDNAVVESVSLEGEPVIVAYSRSPLYRWTFGVSVPRAQVMSAITRNLIMAALGGLGLLILAALISVRVARSISRPVEGLAQAAEALGRGEPVEPPQAVIREVNAVSGSLQKAAAELLLRSADLRSSESRLRLAVQATGLGIWDVDVTSGRRTWSPEFLSILGLNRKTPADPETFLGHVHSEDREWVQERYRAFSCGETGGKYEAEFRILRADTGEERWVVDSGRLVLDDKGKPLRGSGTLMDVTDRRRVEDTLRESEQRFRSMADSAPALIWMTDRDGGTNFLNRYHETFFGYPVEHLMGEDWLRVIHPEDVEDYRDEFRQAFAGRKPWRRQVRVRDANGSTRWLRCEGAPRMAGEDGEFLGYVGCNVDITESKLAADALERRIAERTGELATANRQLLAQIEERERVEATLRQVQRLEAVGQLTSGVAHDFNNLLTVILGNLAFIERGATDPSLKKKLSNMRMAAERGASLVSQLLAFSRRQRLEPKAVNLNETVRGMRELLQSSMGGSVAVDIVLEEDLWPALVDPTQIELIILNLAINARDAMEVGGLLKVETCNMTRRDAPGRAEEPGPGDYVVVSVTDSGSGMNEDVMSRVFEPFFTTKEVGKGSGLGLSQVLGFANQSGGGVRIETREGRGTTVSVFLPRAPVDRAAKSKRKTVELRAVKKAEAPAILLVDDDDLVREVTASKLEEFGYRVKQAANGPSALLTVEQDSSIDLLVLDFAMPGMNGAEVARAARKRRPDIPLMFVTGYADLSALGEFASEPVLHKPFRDEELRKRVAALLKNGTKPAEAGSAA